MKILNKYHKGISIFLTRYAPKKYKSGFTLIELMVVISIISLLSSVVLASVKSAREKAQITKTVAEMKSLQVALELYKNKFGVYPQADSYGNNYDDEPACTYICGITGLRSDLEGFFTTELVNNKFLSKVPHAPNYPNNCNANCLSSGYVLGYATGEDYFQGTLFTDITNPSYFTCNNVKIKNYVIYFFPNTKKVNLPKLGWYSGTTYYPDTSSLIDEKPGIYAGNIYCLAM